MTTLILVRHGETDWNRDGRFQGHADPPLNERGRRQAHALAEQFAREPIEAVYASDLVRAHETATIIAERLGLDVVVDPELRERDVGEWSGLTLAEIEERFPNQLDQWRSGHITVGESRESLTDRALTAALRIAAAHPDGEVLLVAHGGTLRMLRRAAAPRDEPPAAMANGEVARIAVRDGGFRGLH